MVVPARADDRLGIQPVVDLSANGARRVEVSVGQPVTFKGRIEAPPRTGKVVRVEWFTGEGDPDFKEIPVTVKEAVNVKMTHRFTKPGIYFPVLRAATQRDGNRQDIVQVENLDRMRVVVR